MKKFTISHIEWVFFFLLLTFLIVSLTSAPFNKVMKTSNPDILMVGTFTPPNAALHPFLLAINTTDGSVNNVLGNIENFKPGAIDEARSFIFNNKYMMALATFHPGEIIILNFPDMSLAKPVIEFEDQPMKNHPEERVRAVFPGDIDGDGRDELIIGTRPNGTLKYYQFNGGKWSGSTIDEFGRFTSIHDVLVFDLKGDGKQEIFATQSTGGYNGKTDPNPKPPKIIRYQLIGKTWNKKVVWEPKNMTKEDYSIYIHPRYMMTGNFDGESQREVVAATKTGEFGLTGLILLKWTGKEYATYNQIVNDDIKMTAEVIASGDIDNDGKEEIIAPTITNDAIILLKWQDGKWKKNVLTNNLYDPEEKNRQVTALSILDSSSGGYRKLLLATSDKHDDDDTSIGSNDVTKFYILSFNPKKNKWDRTLFQTMAFPRIISWGNFPLSGWNVSK